VAARGPGRRAPGRGARAAARVARGADRDAALARGGGGAAQEERGAAEVLRQVKLVELRTRGLVNSLFTGEYRSVFKGQGMEFAEVREYNPATRCARSTGT
jgi:uncharacterized protein (DUF58 family)